MDKIAIIRQEIERLKGICTAQIKANPEQTFPFVMEMTGYDKLLSFLDTLSEDGFANEGISWEGDGTRGHNSTKSIHITYKDVQDLESIDPKHLVHEKVEEPDKSLEEEIDSEWKKCNPIDEGMGVESAHIHIEAFDIIARHFAEWQYQKDREEFAKIKANTWCEGYNEGLIKGAASQRVKLFEEGLNAVHQGNPSIIERTIAGVFVKYGMDRMKEEMLKDAVEGKIYLGNDYCTYELIASLVGLPRGTHKDGERVRIVVLKEEEE